MSSAGYMLTSSEQRRLANARRLGEKGAVSVAELIDMLSDPSWVVRRAVVEALAAMGEVAVEPLCEALKGARDDEDRLAAAVDALVASRADVEPRVLMLAGDPSPAILVDAAQILGRRHSPSAIPTLAQLTKHPDDNVAVTAIEALGRIGGRAAIETLIATINSGNFFRTFPAIEVLGRSGDPRAVEPLAGLLADPNYLPEAARALGRSGERAAVRPLIELLSSPSDAVVRVASRALWDLRQQFEEKSGAGGAVIEGLIRAQVEAETVRRLTRAFPNAGVPEATAICGLLGAIRSAEAAPFLTKALDASAPIAASAAKALKSIGKSAEAPLIQALREGTSVRRKVLLPVVSRAVAASEVVQCLRDPDPEVRAMACDTLARLANSSAVPDIFPLLADKNMRVAHSAIAAIQALGSRQARTLATEAAGSPNPLVRRSALRILAYFGDSSALKPLLSGLKDPDLRVREAALLGLPYVEDSRAVEAVLETTRSSVGRMRALAMRSLGQLPKGDERSISILLRGLGDPDPWVRYYACQSLGRLRCVAAAPELAGMLGDVAGQVRVSAVEALSHLEAPEALRTLKEAVRSADPEVRRAALVGLGIANRDEDLSIILDALGDAARSSDVATRLIALSAAVHFRSPEVLEALSLAASDPEEQVSSAAIGFLAGRPEPDATRILIRFLGREDASERIRTRVMEALLVPGERRIAVLAEAMDHADDELAPRLVSVLSQLSSRMGNPEARSALIAVMKSENAAARKAAAEVLAAHRDPEMLKVLQEASQSDPDPEVRQICLLLLRE